MHLENIFFTFSYIYINCISIDIFVLPSIVDIIIYKNTRKLLHQRAIQVSQYGSLEKKKKIKDRKVNKVSNYSLEITRKSVKIRLYTFPQICKIFFLDLFAE